MNTSRILSGAPRDERQRRFCYVLVGLCRYLPRGVARYCADLILVTTNSITQVFQRRVAERHLTARVPISLVYAIPDHPWTKALPDSAAVRIAMTVGELGKKRDGLLGAVREAGLNTDLTHH